MKTKMYTQPTKSSVESLISAILVGYTRLQTIASVEVEKDFERGMLKAKLIIPISLQAELGELMLKTFTISTMVNVQGPGIITANQNFEGFVPSKSQLDDYKSSVVGKIEGAKKKVVQSLLDAQKSVEKKIERVKELMILIEEDARLGCQEYVWASVRELNRIACWRTEVDLNLLIETAFGLIELSKQIDYHIGRDSGVEKNLKSALEKVKVREVWFEFNRKQVLKPLLIAPPVLPSGKFLEKLDDEFLAKEFVRQYKK